VGGRGEEQDLYEEGGGMLEGGGVEQDQYEARMGVGGVWGGRGIRAKFLNLHDSILNMMESIMGLSIY